MDTWSGRPDLARPRGPGGGPRAGGRGTGPARGLGGDRGRGEHHRDPRGGQERARRSAGLRASGRGRARPGGARGGVPRARRPVGRQALRPPGGRGGRERAGRARGHGVRAARGSRGGRGGHRHGASRGRAAPPIARRLGGRGLTVPAAASVDFGGRRVPVDSEVTIGRAPDNTFTIDDEEVSRRHARVFRDGGGFVLEDLGSSNGTLVNGGRIGGPHRLGPGDRIGVAGVVLDFIPGAAPPGDGTRMLSRPVPALVTERVQLTGEQLAIGRDESSDLVLRDPNVSRRHAVLSRRPEGVSLADLGSTNGTRVNGELVTNTWVKSGDQIGVGPYVLVLDEEDVVARNEQGMLRLQADALEVWAGEKQILTPTSLSVEPGELVVVIGESGAGKSTLVKAMAGVTQPSGGAITVNGEPLAARLAEIGYVPQDEIVHGLLSVREALDFAARLRLPEDSTGADVDAAVTRVMEELALTEHAETRVSQLSGGQRKRVGVAMELVSRPSLLFLDEPTSGLDPGLETRMMELLRALADNSRGVAVVTHATTNLGICDKLVVMGRGGILAFAGTPDAALRFFGVQHYDDIYAALDATPAAEWGRRYSETGEHQAAPAAVATLPTARGR